MRRRAPTRKQPRHRSAGVLQLQRPRRPRSAVVLVVVMMVVPLPPLLLDLFITINIAPRSLILLVAMYTQEPLELLDVPVAAAVHDALPARAQRLASTRLILLHGDAGRVIQAFGNVRRRRQLRRRHRRLPDPRRHPVRRHHERRRPRRRGRRALHPRRHARQADGDRRRPQRRPDHRRARRASAATKIEREADFYGAMDGACKFVKGDAIAGIVIIADQHPRRHRDRRRPAGHARSATRCSTFTLLTSATASSPRSRRC